MTCPVCQRELAPTISVCFSCGTMVNDTVREELETKIGRVSDPLDLRVHQNAEAVMMASPNPLPAMRIPQQQPQRPGKPSTEPSVPVSPFRVDTSELGNKKTSPTLVEFQHKNPNIPDWRLQLQNAVRQRKNHDEPSVAGPSKTVAPAAAAKAEAPAERTKRPAPAARRSAGDPRIEKALQRIETSREKFLPGAAPTANPPERDHARNGKSFPFGVVEGTAAATGAAVQKATVNVLPKPRLVSAFKIEKQKYDTNKLPPLPRLSEPAVARVELEAAPIAEPILASEIEEHVQPVLALEAAGAEPLSHPAASEEMIADIEEDADDLAPMSSRLTAGLFDLIFGVFASAIVVSPLMLTGGNWFSAAGFLAMAAIFGIVMFVYLTVAIGRFGQTIGMKFFSLELIDAEENEYPTIHQAAVNAAVFLITLPLLGAGFLPAFFNEERRAAHDLFSGTVLVREM